MMSAGRVLTVLLLLAAGSARAVPKPAGGAGRFTTNFGFMSNGRAVTVRGDGSVVLVGNIQTGCKAPDLAVLILDRNLNVPGGALVFESGNGCANFDTPRAAAAHGQDVYIVGDAMGQGFIQKIHASGTPGWYRFEPLATEGLYDVAVDPVDGTIWAVGGSSAPGNPGRLYQYRDDGNNVALIYSNTYFWSGVLETHFYAVAVTDKAVYVGGRAWEAPTFNRTVLMKLARGNTMPEWTFHGSESQDTAVWSLAARSTADGDVIFSEIAGGAVTPNYNIAFARHSAADGSILTKVVVGTGNNPTAWDFLGSVAVHPTLPVVGLAAGTGAWFYNFAMGGLYSWTPSSGNTRIDAIAFNADFNFNAYVAETNDGGVPYDRIQVESIAFTNESILGKTKLIAAPNRLDLTSSTSTILFFAAVKDQVSEVTLKIFDMAGRFVVSMPMSAGSSGKTRDVRWAGTLDNGERLAPGSYLAVAEGAGMDETARIPFLVTRGTPK